MAIVVQRASLLTHLRVVLWTPFILMFAGIYVNKLKLLVILTAVVAVWLMGQLPIELPPRKDLFIGLILFQCSILVLMTLSAAMTTFDHFRFGGWTNEADAISIPAACAFLQALARNDQQAAAQFLATNFSSRDQDFGARFDQWRQKLGNGTTIVTSEQLQTVDHEIFRAALPSLTRLTIDPDQIVLLIPMIASLNQRPGTPMKIGQFVVRRGLHDQIVEFDVIAATRPAILR